MGRVASLERRREVTAYVGLVVFLGGWLMMFAALLFAYALVRLKAPAWPPPGEPVLPLGLPATATVVLVASSLALGRSERPLRLALGLALGVAFLALQVAVWRGAWAAGLRAGGTYGSVLYALSAVHGLHAAVGLIGLAVVLARGVVTGRARAWAWRLYWHFVGAVWLVVFTALWLT